MDLALQARKLGSASARKQRIQERQRQKELLHEQREERRRRLLRYSEVYTPETGSDSSRCISPENDSSAETPSECSVQTPDDAFSPKIEKMQSPEIGSLSSTKKEEEFQYNSKPTILERQRSRSKPRPTLSQPLMLAASLSRPCDFRYDRFSTVVEPVDTRPGNGGSDSVSCSGDEQDEEDYSPIEVATPVAIRMPVSRPSMISVVNSTGSLQGPQRFSVKNINTIMINRPKTAVARTSLALPVTGPNVHGSGGFLASEAKPLEVISPSSCSIISVEPVSTRSLPATDLAATDNNLKKKSSMPMLTKFTHARMNSLKSFIKPQSVSEPPPAVPHVPAAHQSRPSENVSSIMLSMSANRSKIFHAEKHLPPSPQRSVTEPTLLHTVSKESRPQTARTPSQNSITALPLTSSVAALPAQSIQIPTEECEAPSMTRKKSFSNLRRRSGSIGQALKLSSSKTKSPTPAAPLPPMPTIEVPSRGSVTSMTFPTPPPKTGKSARKSGMMGYSPFPPPTQKGEPIGLGLRI